MHIHKHKYKHEPQGHTSVCTLTHTSHIKVMSTAPLHTVYGSANIHTCTHPKKHTDTYMHPFIHAMHRCHLLEPSDTLTHVRTQI